MHDGKPTPPLHADDALDWPGRTATGERVRAAVQRRVERRRRLRRRATLVGASIALMAMAGLAGVNRPVSVPRAESGVVLVLPGREVLPDGSVIERAAGAEVRVEYSPTLRRVAVLRGEAHFAVAPDAGRPFVVVAGDVAVRAVGTAFAVRLAPGDVDVVVTEGRVAVDRAAVDPTAVPVRPLALVAGGARVTVGAQDLAPAAPAPAVVPISAAEIATRLAWRVPRLELDDAPLREVVAAFNRGGGVRLVLAAPDLGELRVSGVVRADNAPALLQLLRVDHGVEAESRGEREFVLRVPRR